MTGVDDALAARLRRARAGPRSRAALPVVIEHVTSVDAPAGADPAGALAAMEERIVELQRGIVERLAELGAHGEVRRAVMANAIFVTLEPDQVEAIASHPDVRIVRWAGPADVAL